MAYLTSRPLSQGELDFWPVSADHFAGYDLAAVQAAGPHHILAHSESGNHHVIDRDAAVIERVSGAIFERLRMIVSAPTKVRNLSPCGHADLDLMPGEYDVIKRRELGLDDVIRSSAD